MSVARPPWTVPCVGINHHLELQGLCCGVIPGVVEVDLAALYGHRATRSDLRCQLNRVIQKLFPARAGDALSRATGLGGGEDLWVVLTPGEGGEILAPPRASAVDKRFASRLEQQWNRRFTADRSGRCRAPTGRVPSPPCSGTGCACVDALEQGQAVHPTTGSRRGRADHRARGLAVVAAGANTRHTSEMYRLRRSSGGGVDALRRSDEHFTPMGASQSGAPVLPRVQDLANEAGLQGLCCRKPAHGGRGGESLGWGAGDGRRFDVSAPWETEELDASKAARQAQHARRAQANLDHVGVVGTI